MAFYDNITVIGQPVDFVGLNTFIYETSGWDPSQQNPIVNDNTGVFANAFNRKAETTTVTSQDNPFTGLPTAARNVPVHQNHRGCLGATIVNHDHISYFINHSFPGRLADPQTGVLPDNQDSSGEPLQRMTASYFTALMLHRHGPYGWPTWKQLRGYQHPVARAHKKNNIYLRIKRNKRYLINELINSRLFITPGHKTEVFCLAAEEARELCVPIVTMGIGSLKERVEHGVTGYIAKNKNEFIEYSCMILNNDDHYLYLKKNLIKKRNSRSYKDVAIDFLKIIYDN